MEMRASAVRSTVMPREKNMYVGGGDKDNDDVLEEPDRPPSAFFLFMDNFRKEYVKKHPADAKKFCAIGVAGNTTWESMSDDAKACYVSKAKELEEEYMSKRDTYLGVVDELKRNNKNEQRRQRAKKAKKDMDTTSDP